MNRIEERLVATDDPLLERRSWHPFCPTCVCNAAWEIASHHLIMILERAGGLVLAGLVLRWLRVW